MDEKTDIIEDFRKRILDVSAELGRLGGSILRLPGHETAWKCLNDAACNLSLAYKAAYRMDPGENDG